MWCDLTTTLCRPGIVHGWWLLLALLRISRAQEDVITVRMYSHNGEKLECMNGLAMEGVSVDPGKCVMGFNYTCGCDGEKKVLLAEKYFPSCTDRKRTSTFKAPFGECVQYGKTQEMFAEERGACPSCCCDSSSCTIYGDPHVKVFDQPDQATISLLAITGRASKPNQQAKHAGNAAAAHSQKFGWGDFWLVKSEMVQIQARYRKVYYPKAKHPFNSTYLTGIAVGGPFLGGHTLLLAPRQKQVVWKAPEFREEILATYPTSFASRAGGEPVKVKYHDKAKLVKDPSHFAVGMDIELPKCVSMTVNRWKKHLDVTLTMPPHAGGPNGMDGQCGNYNSDPFDDSSSLIDERIGYHIPPNELLFEETDDEQVSH
mmetsp:Transcript_9120/g.20298  ORF Transcript_9120/g.20298 Transcript_9120/m.20298 type:complete len:372 (+) Transcript_9120:97-1212(+)